jgi:hypothetical protein
MGGVHIVPPFLPWYYVPVSGQFHALGALPWGKYPWNTLDARLGGPLSQSEHCGERIISCPARNQTPATQTTAYHYTD